MKKTRHHHSELQFRRRFPRRLLDMATPGVGPPSYPFSQPPSYRSQSYPSTPGAASSAELGLEIERDRMDALVRTFHGSIGVLYSERNTYTKQLANNIKGYYSASLYFSFTEIISYDEPSWLDASARHTHLIFIGIPSTKKRGTTKKGKASSLDATSREEALMSRENRKLPTVVVINPAAPRGKTEKKGHFLERFVHLTLQQSSDLPQLAQTAFAIFSATVPVASTDDNVYWSQEPKLLEVSKEDHSLGLSIMTREMSHESLFSRIVLIKSFNEDCLHDLQRQLGKYTHIQFVNSVFLDGLSIDRVTEIFRTVPQQRMQFLVRHIHPRQPRRLLQALPNRLSTYSATKAVQVRKGSDAMEVVPMPLYILGDNYSLQRELFYRLKNEESPSSSVVLPSPGARSDSSATPLLFASPSPTVPQRSLSLAAPMQEPGFFRQQSEPSDNLGSLNAVTRGVSQMRRKVPSSTLPLEFTESDEFIERAAVPQNRFRVDSNFLPDFEKTDEETLSPTSHPPPMKRYGSTHPDIGSPQYVLHMLRQSVDRNLAHLFLKPNGIYLIAIGLEDIVGDPLIQYENLFFWLRLIHSHVKPADIRRIIVVGMYSKLELQVEESEIVQCVQHLNTAIREQMRQNYNLPVKEGGYVFICNLDAPYDLLYLCGCIRMCVEVFIDQAWYFQREFFNSVFMPFESYKNICSDVIRQSRSKVVLRRSKVERLYQHKSEIPSNFWNTLNIYCSVLYTPKSGECLVRPSFVVKLLNTCTQMNHHEIEVFSVRNSSLQQFPIIRAQLLNHRMSGEMHVTEQSHQNTVIEWMKTLEVVYSLGKYGEREIFFIPYLATHSLADSALYSWNDAVAKEFKNASVVLYAKLSIPATQHFFYRLIASLLTDILQNPSISRCFINLGCTEAIIPLNSKGQSSVAYPTLLRYHPIQNIIEFRTTTNRSLAFLYAVEEKLKDVYMNSSYNTSANTDTFRGSMTFYVPATEFEQHIRDSPIWKLGNVGRRSEMCGHTANGGLGLLGRGGGAGSGSLEEDGVCGECGECEDGEGEKVVNGGGEEEGEEEEEEEDGPENLLLKTKYLTDPGSRETEELRAWASSAPEMKDLSSDTFLEVAKILSTNEYWTTVASKLRLMSFDDVNYFRSNPVKGGNGSEVLQRWQESNLTYRDLVDALKELNLNRAADVIEKHYQKPRTSR